MKLWELMHEDQLALDEALGKWATLGALGAGALSSMGSWAQTSSLAGREHLNLPPPVPRSSTVTPVQSPVVNAPASTTASVPVITTTRNTPRTSSGVHAQFPASLHHVASMQPNERVAAFVNTMAPLVQQENQRILNNRARARSIIAHRNPSAQDQAWLSQQMDHYGATTHQELMRRMDVIPVSLALAQSAIETGWGQDHIARAGNAFFGQRATRPDHDHILGPVGERYRLYDSPHLSVRSYMHNINTHRSYDQLRTLRAQMRAQNKTPQGIQLASGLMSYSTRGVDYVRQVQQLIRARRLNQWD
jgi:uncharacterized FlgJ-related protein